MSKKPGGGKKGNDDDQDVTLQAVVSALSALHLEDSSDFASYRS